MKASRFNLLTEDGLHFALWNLGSGRFVLISGEEYRAFSSKALQGLSPDRIPFFTEIGALLPEGKDEVGELYASVTENMRNDAPHFRILTTSACNASCAYCYEKGLPVSRMDDACAVQTASFIESRTAECGGPARLSWFGGEPLLNVPAISRICDCLQESGTPFRSSVYTNGLLFNPFLLDTALSLWNLRHAQITLDAAEGEYERIKGLPAGSFRKVFNNIRLLLDAGVSVSVRINYDGEEGRVFCLAEELQKLLGRGKLSVYISPLYDGRREVDADTAGKVLSLELSLAEMGLALEETFLLPPRNGRCFACWENGYTVAPDGKLFNCSHALSSLPPIGDVYHPDEKRKEDPFTRFSFSASCRDCRYLPLCCGGCRAAELGVSESYQCFPYKNAMERIAGIRLEKEVRRLNR